MSEFTSMPARTTGTIASIIAKERKLAQQLPQQQQPKEDQQLNQHPVLATVLHKEQSVVQDVLKEKNSADESPFRLALEKRRVYNRVTPTIRAIFDHVPDGSTKSKEFVSVY